MKKYLLALSAFLTPFLTFSQEQTLSQKIDTVFSEYTGWFVEFIFYEIRKKHKINHLLLLGNNGGGAPVNGFQRPMLVASIPAARITARSP